MAITDCQKHCDQNPDIPNCSDDCLACQSAIHEHIIYDCCTSGHEKCPDIESIPGCEPTCTEPFSNMKEEEDYQIQVLVTVSIILLFLLYVII